MLDGLIEHIFWQLLDVLDAARCPLISHEVSEFLSCRLFAILFDEVFNGCRNVLLRNRLLLDHFASFGLFFDLFYLLLCRLLLFDRSRIGLGHWLPDRVPLYSLPQLVERWMLWEPAHDLPGQIHVEFTVHCVDEDLYFRRAVRQSQLTQDRLRVLDDVLWHDVVVVAKRYILLDLLSRRFFDSGNF